MKLLKLASLLVTLVLGCATHAIAAEDADQGNQAWLEHVCSQDNDKAKAAEWEQHYVDHVAERLSLTDKQKAAFKDLEDTRHKLRADNKARVCANKPDLSTLEKRLAFIQSLLENRVAYLKATTPKILAFYNTLDEKQKAEFDGVLQSQHHHHHWRHHHWGDSGGWHHHHHHHHHHED